MKQFSGVPLLAAVVDATSTPVFSSFLGKGQNLAGQNMWAGSHSRSFDVFGVMPDSCYEVVDCPHVADTESSFYSSTQEWSHKVTTDLTGDVSGMYEAVTATVSASYGSTNSEEAGSTKQSFYTESYNRQACYQMRPSCLFNKSYILPELFEVAAKLPVGLTDPTSLGQWEEQFLERFGSYVTIYSEHGARVKSLTSIDKQTQTTNDCLQLKACASIGYLTNTAKVCPSQQTCDLHTGVDQTISKSCVIAGGSGQTAVSDEICSGNGPAYQQFMASGDMTSGTSAYRFQFKPISHLLTQYGYPQQAAALDSAVKWKGCAAPQFTYQQTANGAWDCVCTLQCQNRGTVDPSTCTCNCVGNALQGFRGTFCEKDYGMCQPGLNSASIGPHCGDQPFCGDNQCAASQICCKPVMTNNGACCPWGSTCDGWAPWLNRCVPHSEHTANSTALIV